MNDTLRDQRGFTLIETVIALLIFMIVGLGAVSMFVYAVKYNSGAEERALAVAVAQKRLEDLRNVPWNDALLTATTATGTTDSSTLAGHTFSVNKVVTNNTAAPATTTLKTITISVIPLTPGGGWAATPVTIRTQRAALTSP